MKHRSYKNTNLLVWIVIILGFSFLYFSYFFVYIPRQEAQLKQRAFRILKEYGSNINDKHNYYIDHFNNYAPYYGIKHFRFQRVPENRKSDSVKVQQVINGLFAITTDCRESDDRNRPELFQVANNRMSLQFHNKIEVADTIRIGNLINEDSLKWLIKFGLWTSVPVEHFMNGLKFDRLFENIILFADSQVYYNSIQDVFIDINNPVALYDSIKTIQGGTYLKLNIRGEDMHLMILPINFINKEFFLAGFIADDQYRNITRTINNQLLIFLAGLLLLVFIGMPILKVIFLSPNERLKSLDASSSVFSAILGTGLLILLAVSYIKQQFSDSLYHRNRIQSISDSLYANVEADIHSIKNFYFTIDSLSRDSLSQIIKNARLNDSIAQSIGDKVNSISFPRFRETNLYVPFNEMVESVQKMVQSTDSIAQLIKIDTSKNSKSQLLSLSQSISLLDSIIESEPESILMDSLVHTIQTEAQFIAGQSMIDTSAFTKDKSIFDLVRKQFFAKGNGKFHHDKDVLISPFPLNEVFLINENGRMSKAITSTPFSDLVDIDLKQRKYFSNVKDTKLAWASSDNLKFYIESIQSYNTGDGETAISFYTTAFDTIGPVLAITSVIPSLYYQVVPKDVEFLIIDESGKVLYHSIKSKNLHENFLEECDSHARLIKAVDMRVDDKFHLNYNGRKWHARIRPVKDTPLYHITLIDQIPGNNKNARIFLFSFYFFVVSVFLLIAGIVIKRWVFPSSTELPVTWFMNWLDFKSRNHFLYKKLIGLLLLAVVLQGAGVFFLKKPVAVFFYQFFFMVYVIYISMLVLKRRVVNRKNYFYGILFILFIFLIQISLSWQFDLKRILVFLGIIFLILVYVTNFVLVNLEKGQNADDSYIKPKQRLYLLFLLLLLVNLSVVPVIQFYISVKHTEDRLWLQEQLFKVANDNLHLKSVYNEYEADWFKKIQGNNIDNLKVSYTTEVDEPDDPSGLTNSDRIYLNLFDPITKAYYPGELFKGHNFTGEWVIGDSLKFSKAGKEGAVSVTSGGRAGIDYLNLGVIIIIAGIVIIGSIWLLVNYLASVIFNLHPESNPEADVDWFNVLPDPGKRRILLKSFNGHIYKRHSAGYLKNRHQKPYVEVENPEIKAIQVSQIIDAEIKPPEFLNSQALVWVSGLDNYIYQIETHESLLSFLMLLNQSISQKVIVDLPFDIDLITEYYDEYIAENDLKPEYVAQLYSLKKRWEYIFRNYYNHHGYTFFIPKKCKKSDAKDQDGQIKINEDFQREFKNDPYTWYNVIWENLSSKEKIVLYDLADDGLLNRKNKTIINRLINKKLILTDNKLELFSADFRAVVMKKLSPSKVKAIESELGLKGPWRNIRFLVLLILIPLAAFIFISQGISMEKVLGIIGGTLAAITGLLRLFDSSSFKQAAS